MTDYGTYIKNIYRIKSKIQELDDEFYGQDNWYEIDPSKYRAARKVLCDQLDEAEKAY